LSLAVVRDLRVARAPVTPDDLAALETDVLAGFVLARAAACLADSTIASDVVHLEQIRAWFGRALWEMEPAEADVYFGKALRDTAKGTRLSRAQALKTFFLFLELRHKVEIHQMTGRVVECPIDEMNESETFWGRQAMRVVDLRVGAGRLGRERGSSAGQHRHSGPRPEALMPSSALPPPKCFALLRRVHKPDRPQLDRACCDSQ
jgi:hypothetical protein